MQTVGLKPLREPLLDEPPPNADVAARSADRMAKAFEMAANAVSAAGETGAVGQQKLNACWTASLPFINIVLAAIFRAAPHVAWVATKLYELYLAAPQRVLKMVFGGALCFFGGTFTASIAAIEAFRTLGGPQVFEAISVVAADVRAIGTANAADTVDADNDGTPDVKQAPPHELAKRKLAVAMKSITQPAMLSEAVARLWGCYLAILATMKMQFAQTTAIALGIVETVQYPAARLLAPGLTRLLGADLAHWSETLLLSLVRLVAIILAWYLQMIISAFYSALRGGKLFADGLCDLVVANGWSVYVEKLPFVATPFDPDTTHVDEAVAYTLAALGFSTQLLTGFALPFPLNIALLPLEVIEWLLRWQVTFGSGDGGGGGGGGSAAASG